MHNDELMTMANEFVKSFYAGDIQIITPPDDFKQTSDEVMDDVRNLAHNLIRNQLGDAINRHLTEKSADSAYSLVKLITSARNQGMIVESENNLSKSKRLEQENIQLKNEKTKLEKEIQRMSKLNEDLHRIIDKLGAKRPDDNVLGEQ